MVPSHYSEFRRWLADDAVLMVDGEMLHAVSKHGWNRTPASLSMSNHEFMSVLMEEVGECSHEINYDSANPENFRAELIQVATMALARLYALDTSNTYLNELEAHPIPVYNPSAGIAAGIEMYENSYLKTKTNDLEPPR